MDHTCGMGMPKPGFAHRVCSNCGDTKPNNVPADQVHPKCILVATDICAKCVPLAARVTSRQYDENCVLLMATEMSA